MNVGAIKIETERGALRADDPPRTCSHISTRQNKDKHTGKLHSSSSTTLSPSHTSSFDAPVLLRPEVLLPCLTTPLHDSFPWSVERDLKLFCQTPSQEFVTHFSKNAHIPSWTWKRTGVVPHFQMQPSHVRQQGRGTRGKLPTSDLKELRSSLHIFQQG